MSITQETRREAFAGIQPKRPKRKSQIIQCLQEHGPQTSDEVMARLGYQNPNSVRPRMTELMGAGHVRAVGKRRDPDANISATVW